MNLYEEKKKLSLDDPRTTVLHREIIRQNKFLKEIYIDWYSSFKNYLSQIPEGKILEIGSGGGFCKEIIPEVITSDILELDYVDMTFSAEAIPFEDASLSAIFMINVLHHIPDPAKFIEEARRVLKSGGIIYMIEPANTLMSTVIYKLFHHEPFVTNAPDWTIPGNGPLSDANMAIPYIMFKRDFAKFQSRFPEMELISFKYHTPYRYLLSGGVSRPSFLPYALYKPLYLYEKLNSPFARLNALFNTIIVRKK